MGEALHTIKFVAQQTGLSPHTIRAWERRYAALTPERTPTNRRLYSADEVEKLGLLHRAVGAGHSIGQIARLPVAELKRLLIGPNRTLRPGQSAEGIDTPAPVPSAEGFLTACMHSAERMDAEGLDLTLTRAAGVLGTAVLVDKVLLPLLHRVGERWRGGEMRPAQEHLVASAVRTQLGRLLDALQPAAPAPRFIATTPVGQLHELGALLAAISGASEGWRAIYLGPNLPAEEIAGAARQARANAIALSILLPPDSARLHEELSALREYVGPEMPIFAGGRLLGEYRPVLDAAGVKYLDDMHALRVELERLRTRMNGQATATR